MKKTITLVIVLVILAILIVGGVLIYERFGKETKTKEGIPITIRLENGQTQNVIADKFIPSYIVQFRDPSSDFNLKSSTEVLDALWSTPNRNSQKYLSLLDAGVRADIERVNRESENKLLAESLKNEPFPTSDELQTIFEYWVEVNMNNKIYRIIVGKQTIKGQEFTGLTVTLVKQDDYWFQTFDLDNTPLLTNIGSKNFEEFIRK